MTQPRFTRRGTWWVESTDGRTIQRTGRDLLRFVDGGEEYTIWCEIGGELGLGVSAKGIRVSATGSLAPPQVWARARELLEISGDAYDPYPDDSVQVQVAHRWNELNEYEGSLRLSTADPTLLPAPVTFARYVAAGNREWDELACGTRAVVRIELELSAPVQPGAGPRWDQLGVETSISGTVVAPGRVRRSDGFVLAIDPGAHECPLEQPVVIVGLLQVKTLRPIE